MPTPPSQESSSDSVFTDPGELATIPHPAESEVTRTSAAAADTVETREAKSPFTIARHKKIHLSVLSPRISERLS